MRCARASRIVWAREPPVKAQFEIAPRPLRGLRFASEPVAELDAGQLKDMSKDIFKDLKASLKAFKEVQRVADDSVVPDAQTFKSQEGV